MSTSNGWKRTAAQGEQTNADGTYKAVRNEYGEWHLFALYGTSPYTRTSEYVNTYSTLKAAKAATLNVRG